MTIADEKIVLYTWLENKNLMWQKNNLTKSKFILKIAHNGTTLSSKMCFIFLAIVRNSFKTVFQSLFLLLSLP